MFDNAETRWLIWKQHPFHCYKADGLALGKGVIIAETREQAKAGVKTIMEDKVFGASGDHIVVEEFLTGPEVSVLAFTDGQNHDSHGFFHGPQTRAGWR